MIIDRKNLKFEKKLYERSFLQKTNLNIVSRRVQWDDDGKLKLAIKKYSL